MLVNFQVLFNYSIQLLSISLWLLVQLVDVDWSSSSLRKSIDACIAPVASTRATARTFQCDSFKPPLAIAQTESGTDGRKTETKWSTRPGCVKSPHLKESHCITPRTAGGSLEMATMEITEEIIQELRHRFEESAIKCSERCLYQSSKWYTKTNPYHVSLQNAKKLITI